jgi:phenylacetic acid degradation operon negative regulatory protein
MAMNGPTSVDLPRVQVGANPQHLLLGLLIDYWLGREEQLPSAGLVALLAEFGITPASARAAIGRLARRSVLDTSKQGRRTFYGLAPGAGRALVQTQRRVVEFGTGDRPWDGSWTTVIFSVPEEQRDLRYAMRTKLRWLGYAPLYDGVWVSPGADDAQTVELLESVGVVDATVLRSSVTYTSNGGDPLSAWDLVAIRRSYEAFIDEFEPLLRQVERGQVGAAEALVARTRVKDCWRELVSSDPELPENLLPSGWPRREAQRMFAELYDLLGPLAEARVRQLLSGPAPDLAPEVRHLTTTSDLPAS